MSNYTLGKCRYCKEYKALKDGICKECENKKMGGVPGDLPDWMDDLLNGSNPGDKL